jgi:SAM-dependent methyltransferase
VRKIVDDVQEIDVTEIMEQIRAKIRTRQQDLSRSDAASAFSNGSAGSDLASLQSGYDIYHIHFTSHRKGLGQLIVLAKKVLRKLLTPILERQLAYNAANARMAAYLYEGLEEVAQQQTAAIQELSERLEGMRQQQSAALRALRTEVMEQLEETVTGQVRGSGEQQAEGFQELRQAVVEQVRGLGEQQAEGFQGLRQAVVEQVRGLGEQQTMALQTLRNEVFSNLEPLAESAVRLREVERVELRLKTELRLQERRLNIVLEEARKRLPGPFMSEQSRILADEERHALDALYVSFEDQFRGSREDIKERMRVYLPIIHEANVGTEEMPVLDLGCGRGEWLELLREEGLRARGVDLNRVLVEACRQQGLEIVEGDAIGYLRSLPDASLGVVTAFHLIEHLPFDGFVRLLDETVRVLKPGGVAIFETPNPENVLVGSYTFYLDPTHRNPLPSSVVKFLAEARGLCRVGIMPLHPYSTAYHVEEAGLDVAKRFNEYFYGPQDYALTGWKV